MNLENKNDFVTNDIISDTKTLLKKDKCGDIWTRSCPKCHEQLTYNQIGHRNYHERKGSLCRTCCRIGKSYLSEEGRKILSIKGRKYKHTMESIQKIIDSRRKQYPPTEGKVRNEESKEKMRMSVIKRLERNGIIRSYNPKACNFIDKLNEERGWNLRHAMNGGEIQIAGFFMDGYDKTQNIIFEYDEPHHYRSDGSLKKKDQKRQEILVNKVNPKMFFRYNEETNNLYRII